MNIKQESQNQNINLGQSEEFSVYEQIENGEEKYIACSKKKRIKITPMYTVHNTRHDVVLYKVELQKYKPFKIGKREFGDYESVTAEVFNVSGDEMQKFMNFLVETFALEVAEVNTFVSVDTKGGVRDILRKYKSDRDLFETLSMSDLDSINGNITLQNLKNIRNDMQSHLDYGGEREYWHPFLKKYNWILSQIFVAPYILFQDEFYVGGKCYDRRGGIQPDFGLKNIKTGNCAIIEIKDAKQPLITSYRQNEYRISNELAGAISQIIKQKDTLYKQYWTTAYNDEHKLIFNADNIKSVLIIGKIPQTVVEQSTFEAFRNELKGVEIITFDELLEKIELQIKIIEGTGF